MNYRIQEHHTTCEAFIPNLLRAPSQNRRKTADKKAPGEKFHEEEGPDEGDAIRCRACGQAITRPEERDEVDGSHRHTFANPHGIVFQIGCFKTAQGCVMAGPASDEFTWFRGFTWRVAVCGFCLNHLGWYFASAGGASFYGLILDRLIERH